MVIKIYIAFLFSFNRYYGKLPRKSLHFNGRLQIFAEIPNKNFNSEEKKRNMLICTKKVI